MRMRVCVYISVVEGLEMGNRGRQGIDMGEDDPTHKCEFVFSFIILACYSISFFC